MNQRQPKNNHTATTEGSAAMWKEPSRDEAVETRFFALFCAHGLERGAKQGNAGTRQGDRLRETPVLGIRPKMGEEHAAHVYPCAGPKQLKAGITMGAGAVAVYPLPVLTYWAQMWAFVGIVYHGLTSVILTTAAN